MIPFKLRFLLSPFVLVLNHISNEQVAIIRELGVPIPSKKEKQSKSIA